MCVCVRVQSETRVWCNDPQCCCHLHHIWLKMINYAVGPTDTRITRSKEHIREQKQYACALNRSGHQHYHIADAGRSLCVSTLAHTRNHVVSHVIGSPVIVHAHSRLVARVRGLCGDAGLTMVQKCIRLSRDCDRVRMYSAYVLGRTCKYIRSAAAPSTTPGPVPSCHVCTRTHARTHLQLSIRGAHICGSRRRSLRTWTARI